MQEAGLFVWLEDEARSGINQEQKEGHEQVPVLPTELLNNILSYTGSKAAVLAAGAAGMRTWSDQNIADWLIQHCAAIHENHDSLADATVRAIQHRLDGPARTLFAALDESLTWFLVMAMAAQHGCVCVISMFLGWLRDHTVDRNLAREMCHLMMITACNYGQQQVVKELLDGAWPYAYDLAEADGKLLMAAALNQAAKYGHVNILIQLLDTTREHHANANDDNSSALIAAARNGRLECVRMLLDTSRPNHARADARDSEALLAAAKNGHSDILRELLWREHHAADPSSWEADQALEVAISQGNLECCRLLLDYPALLPFIPIDQYLIEKATANNNPEVLALIKEAYRRVDVLLWGPKLIIRRLGKHIVWICLCVFGAEIIVPQEIPSYAQAYTMLLIALNAIMVIELVIFAFFWIRRPARVKLARQKAAALNAEYRAAWYNAQRK